MNIIGVLGYDVYACIIIAMAKWQKLIIIPENSSYYNKTKIVFRINIMTITQCENSCNFQHSAIIIIAYYFEQIHDNYLLLY